MIILIYPNSSKSSVIIISLYLIYLDKSIKSLSFICKNLANDSIFRILILCVCIHNSFNNSSIPHTNIIFDIFIH